MKPRKSPWAVIVAKPLPLPNTFAVALYDPPVRFR